ncbi:MAG: hypothetical protein ACYDEF_07790 [Methanosarcina sp.]
MIVLIRKNVSLDETHLQKLQPLLEKHRGNLSAAVREVIDLVSLDLESRGKPEDISVRNEGKSSETKDQLIKSRECVMMSQQMMKWLVGSCTGKLIDEDVVNGLINPYIITTLSELEENLNCSSERMGWEIKVSGPFNEGLENGPKIMDFTGGDIDFREFLVEVVCIFLSRWANLDVEAIHRKSNSITIYLRSFVRQDLQEVAPGIRKYFGSRDILYREFERKPEFWTNLAELYLKSNYQRVNLDKDLFEALAAGRLPDITKYFEIEANCSIREIPLSELLPLFKHFVGASQLVNDVEIRTEKGKEQIKIRHDYSDEKVIEILIQLLSNVFASGWHNFSVSSMSGLIIFDFSFPGILKEEIGTIYIGQDSF